MLHDARTLTKVEEDSFAWAARPWIEQKLLTMLARPSGNSTGTGSERPGACWASILRGHSGEDRGILSSWERNHTRGRQPPGLPLLSQCRQAVEGPACGWMAMLEAPYESLVADEMPSEEAVHSGIARPDALMPALNPDLDDVALEAVA